MSFFLLPSAENDQNEEKTGKHSLIIALLCGSSTVNYYYHYTHLMASFSRTTWVSQYQKGKTSLDSHKAKADGVFGCSGISWTL